MPEVAREGREGKPSCTRKPLGEIRSRKWQLAEALSRRLISTVTTEKLSTCWDPAIHWDHLFSPWSFPACRVYLSFRVANGDQKVLFPFHGDTYGFPSKSWSGKMYFLLALHHPKQRNGPFFTAPSEPKQCLASQKNLSSPRKVLPSVKKKCAWEVTQIKAVVIRQWNRSKNTFECPRKHVYIKDKT